MKKFKPEYHEDVDVAFFELNEGKYSRSIFPDDAFIFDLDEEGTLLAIEIVGFKNDYNEELLVKSLAEYLSDEDAEDLSSRISLEKEKV